MAIGDIFALQFQTDSQSRKNTVNLGYRQILGADTQLVTEVLVNQWWTDFGSIVKALFATTVSIQCVYARRVAPAIGIPFERTLFNEIGTASGTAYPNDSPFVTSLQTDSTSSKDNGRVYISGFPESFIANGELTNSILSGTITTWENQLQDTLDAGSPGNEQFEPVVIDRVTAGVDLLPVLANHITNAFTEAFIESQRRRRTRKTGGFPAI